MANQLKLTVQSTYKQSPKYSIASKPSFNPDKNNNPGPGNYGTGVDVTKGKYARAPVYSISGTMEKSRSLGELPGPGKYTPSLKPFYSPKWPFSTDDRLKEKRLGVAPGPGQYEVRGNNEGLAMSISHKPEGRAHSSTPGPGQYKNNYNQVLEKLPTAAFARTGRGELVMSKSPGPGAYENVDAFGMGVGVLRRAPSYTIKSKVKDGSKSITPGPSACATSFT